jgi:hypothetical protein
VKSWRVDFGRNAFTVEADRLQVEVSGVITFWDVNGRLVVAYAADSWHSVRRNPDDAVREPA